MNVFPPRTPAPKAATRGQQRLLDLALAFSTTPGYPPTRAPATSALRALTGAPRGVLLLG